MKTGQAPQEYSPGDVVVFLLRKERRTLILTTGELRALPPSDAPAPSGCKRLRDGGNTSTFWVVAGVCAELALLYSLSATAAGSAGPVGHAMSKRELKRSSTRRIIKTWPTPELPAGSVAPAPSVAFRASSTRISASPFAVSSFWTP